MSRIIGIDLGTTNSACAYLADDGPRLIPNALGGRLTPSVVAIDADGRLVVGPTAREVQVLHPERCAAVFKRFMGGDDWTRTLNGRTYRPEELSALVLRSLKADAEAHFGEPVTRAVITCPAYFNDRQRKATIHAGQVAGLTVERILNEPTAAALAYGFHESQGEKTLLVFDLGGGTLDVSVVDLFEGTLEVRASCGENFLGGEDFTRTLAARVLEQAGRRFETAELQSPLLVARLVQQCEQAKCRLTREESVVVRVPDDRGEFPADAQAVLVMRGQFEQWTQALLARVELPVRRALGDAKLTKEGVHEVLLVGGATRMPQVVNRVAELLGREPQCRINPDEVVALGAAVQAGLIGRHAAVADLVVTDVAPFTLGVSISKEFGHEHVDGYFLPLIHRNTTIPVSRVERVQPVHPRAPMIQVRVYQGEARRVQDNLLLGEFEVHGIPADVPDRGVELRFTYDLNGVLEVEATVVATGRKFAHVIAKHARGLTPQQVEDAVRAMAALKTHPRAEAVNRHLLKRAERLYQELPVEGRNLLGQLLDAFEDALTRQEPAAIATHRETLARFLDAADPSHGDGDEPAPA